MGVKSQHEYMMMIIDTTMKIMKPSPMMSLNMHAHQYAAQIQQHRRTIPTVSHTAHEESKSSMRNVMMMIVDNDDHDHRSS